MWTEIFFKTEGGKTLLIKTPVYVWIWPQNRYFQNYMDIIFMKEWFKDQDLDFVTLYFDDPDETGHKHGPDSSERREAVKKKLTELDHLNIIITADHGMATVFKRGQVKEIVLTDIPGFSYKDLQFHLLDYGPSAMLLPKEGMLDKVYHALKGGHPNPGCTNKGEHGYDNEDMDMKPFFRAVGPDFHRNLLVGPFETVNVYPLMCYLLGIKPEINDGSLDNTQHMLISSGEPRDSGGRSK
uniref:Ectonucleotide pyrophosphatase/phosphodiesterase 7 n=1 Tax=Sinocyclocheilus grahami TaxID=75366 RepID=A0A672N7I3_SINGR